MAAVLVYGVHVALAIATEIGDVQQSLIVLMIIFTTIFTIGAMISFMFLKQVIPHHIRSVSEKTKEGNGEINEGNEEYDTDF